MKLLVVFLLVALLLVFLYRRLRPYLRILKEIVGISRGFLHSQVNPINHTSARRADRREHLVRCSACGTWVPATRVLINQGSEAVFCSSDCARLDSREKQTPVSAGK